MTGTGVATLETSFVHAEDRLDRVADRLVRIEDRLDRLDWRLRGVEIKLAEIGAKLDQLASKIPSWWQAPISAGGLLAVLLAAAALAGHMGLLRPG